MRAGSQNARLLAVLRDGHWHTTAELLRAVPCIVHSRIHELRDRHGCVIVHETTGPGAAGSRYRLLSERDERQGDMNGREGLRSALEGVAGDRGNATDDPRPEPAARSESSRTIQTPACDRCTQGVMDATNNHWLGICRCDCHTFGAEPEARGGRSPLTPRQALANGEPPAACLGSANEPSAPTSPATGFPSSPAVAGAQLALEVAA